MGGDSTGGAGGYTIMKVITRIIFYTHIHVVTLPLHTVPESDLFEKDYCLILILAQMKIHFHCITECNTVMSCYMYMYMYMQEYM